MAKKNILVRPTLCMGWVGLHTRPVTGPQEFGGRRGLYGWVGSWIGYDEDQVQSNQTR